MTIKNLSQVKTKYILFLLDDYFLQNTVDTVMINEIFLKAQKIGAKYVKLTENHRGVLHVSEISSSFLQITQKDTFGVCLQASIWDKEYFLQLLNSNESPWEFEKNVKKRISNYNDLYFLKKNALDINFGGVMHYGLIERRFYKKSIKDGIYIDKNHMMTRRQQTATILDDIMNNLHLNRIIPVRMRMFLKRLLGVIQ